MVREPLLENSRPIIPFQSARRVCCFIFTLSRENSKPDERDLPLNGNVFATLGLKLWEKFCKLNRKYFKGLLASTVVIAYVDRGHVLVYDLGANPEICPGLSGNR